MLTARPCVCIHNHMAKSWDDSIKKQSGCVAGACNSVVNLSESSLVSILMNPAQLMKTLGPMRTCDSVTSCVLFSKRLLFCFSVCINITHTRCYTETQSLMHHHFATVSNTVASFSPKCSQINTKKRHVLNTVLKYSLFGRCIDTGNIFKAVITKGKFAKANVTELTKMRPLSERVVYCSGLVFHSIFSFSR